MQSRIGAVVQLIGIDLLGSVIWFPVWWYTTGLLMMLGFVRRAIDIRIRQYGFRIWIRHFFVPMYGQYGFTGRAVSLFMRAIVLIGRSIALGVETTIYAAGIAMWAIAPIALILLLGTHLIGYTVFGLV